MIEQLSERDREWKREIEMSTQRKCVDVCVRERASNVRDAESVERATERLYERARESVCF